MMPIEEADHIRVLLTNSMMSHEQKMGLIALIRNNTIVDIVKIRPETVAEGHDLTLPYQAYHFISELREENIPPDLAANLDLLEACTRTVDNGQINENAICAAYAKTDGNLISGHKYKKSQSKKAKLPRGIITEIKKKLSGKYPNYSAKELWPYLYAELDEMQLDPEENDDVPGEEWYTYDHNDGRKSIKFRRFANIKINQ